MTMTRAEHLAWCKQRALAYCDSGDLPQAYTSLASDLGKHPETMGHSGIMIGAMLLFSGELMSDYAMRRFIEGFN